MSKSHSGEKNKTIGYLAPKYSRINAYVHHDLGGNIREVPGVAKNDRNLKEAGIWNVTARLVYKRRCSLLYI